MNAATNNAATVQELIDNDHTNDNADTIVVLFEEAHSAPYFLKQGEQLPTTWVNAYEIKSVHLA
jgi:hypothetical protein